jgi:orsellinic acid C2-O-methyltransferase
MMSEGDDSPTQRLLTCVTSSWMAQALHVAAELGLADHLAGGPRTGAELAALTGTHAPSLHRLLRALCALGVCEETEAGAFALTPLGEGLRRDAPASLRHWILWWGTNLWSAWGNLLYSVRTGRSARTLALGTEGFAHLEGDPAAAAIFNRALQELTRMVASAVVAAYDFAGVGELADVGGGHGEMLATVLVAHPAMRGLVFDRPHAEVGARERLAAAGVGERARFVAGDFFEAVPGGADAYLLKSVIHDWDEEDGVRILGVCRAAMRPGARLLLVEQVMPERMRETSRHQSLARSDLTMLVALAAQERTEGEFRALLARAGFEVTGITQTDTTFAVIEARPVH